MKAVRIEMRRLVVLAAIGVTATVFGCNSILGIDQATLEPSGTGGSGTGGFGAGGLPSSCAAAAGDDACMSCDKASCCDSLTACLDSSDCVAAVNCAGSCTDSACTASCLSQHPTGGVLEAAWSACLTAKCNSECSGATTCAAAPDPALVQSCVLAMACDPWPFTNISNCISLGSVKAIPYLSCANNAQTCQQIGTCIGRYFGDRSQCTGGGTGWVCNGNVAQNCDTGVPEIVDCTFWGATCSSGPNWPCVLPTGACTETDNLWHCSGNDAYFCVSGQPHGQNCADESGVCVEKTPGQAYCSHSQTPCTDYKAQRCSGNSMTYCNADGYLYQYDCGASVGTCQNFASSGAGYCFSPGCAPDAKCTESCSGSVMSLCVGQAPMQVDCKNYGFAACTTKTDSTGYTSAGCVK